ncbi:MAG: BlaI/MecI/CopY family transcriptional regulator [Planctomycetota bacterium]
MRLSDAEWTVMAALWEESPRTARDVHSAVSGDTEWSYSTVRTLLGRLAEKDAVRFDRDGNRLLYRATLTEDDAQRSALRSLVDRAFGGRFGSLVQHMVDDRALSDGERRALARMLEDEARPRRKGRRVRSRGTGRKRR